MGLGLIGKYGGSLTTVPCGIVFFVLSVYAWVAAASHILATSFRKLALDIAFIATGTLGTSFAIFGLSDGHFTLPMAHPAL